MLLKDFQCKMKLQIEGHMYLIFLETLFNENSLWSSVW